MNLQSLSIVQIVLLSNLKNIKGHDPAVRKTRNPNIVKQGQKYPDYQFSTVCETYQG